MGSLKYKKNPWPTDGATVKQLNRIQDRMITKHDRQQRKLDQLRFTVLELTKDLAAMSARLINLEELFPRR